MASMIALAAEPPPMQEDEDGVFRVGGTRVRLDTVVTAFRNGCTPEEIQIKYPSLNLPDIYSVLAYYLRHAEEVDAYLAERRLLQEETEREIEQRFPSTGLRERLLDRRRTQR